MTNAKPKVNPTEIIAALRDVTVTYDGYQTRALSRVTLELRRGEVTGVLGAEGSGKTTLLKILAGRLGITEGSAKVFGRSPRGGAKARIGYLPGKAAGNRSPGFFNRLWGGGKDSRPVARGAAQLAQAMLGNRELLVLDDPFADLPVSEVAEAKALIQDLVSRGKTVVLSSDALMDVKELCHRLVILEEGKVQAVGTLPELLSGGAAVRYFTAVLPNEIVECMLGVLRKGILAPSAAQNSEVARAPVEEAAVGSTGQRLASVTVMPPSDSKATKHSPVDPIDHGKLEDLTKTKKPQ